MRILFFVSLIILTVTLPWWIAFIFWIPYALYFTAYELVLLGVLLDAYFGLGVAWHFIYTAWAMIVCTSMEWVKPRMSFYSRTLDTR